MPGEEQSGAQDMSVVADASVVAMLGLSLRGHLKDNPVSSDDSVGSMFSFFSSHCHAVLTADVHSCILRTAIAAISYLSDKLTHLGMRKNALR